MPSPTRSELLSSISEENTTLTVHIQSEEERVLDLLTEFRNREIEEQVSLENTCSSQLTGASIYKPCDNCDCNISGLKDNISNKRRYCIDRSNNTIKTGTIRSLCPEEDWIILDETNRYEFCCKGITEPICNGYWSECSKECGTKQWLCDCLSGCKGDYTVGDLRLCEHNEGKCCKGNTYYDENKKYCSVKTDCNDNWTEWSECSADCGGGQETREYIQTEDPSLCKSPEISIERRQCNTQPCEIDSEVKIYKTNTISGLLQINKEEKDIEILSYQEKSDFKDNIIKDISKHLSIDKERISILEFKSGGILIEFTITPNEKGENLDISYISDKFNNDVYLSNAGVFSKKLTNLKKYEKDSIVRKVVFYSGPRVNSQNQENVIVNEQSKRLQKLLTREMVYKILLISITLFLFLYIIWDQSQ